MSKSKASKNIEELALGTLTQKDDVMYILAEKENGTKYWKKTLLGSDKLPKTWPGSNNFIRIGEVSSRIILSSNFTVSLKVDDEFLEVIKKKPLSKKSVSRNSYIYLKSGEMFKSGWIFAGSHTNNVNQTGIILSASKREFVLPREDEQKMTDNNLWMQIYNNMKIPWDDRKSLDKVSKEISPLILFVGCTSSEYDINVFVHITDKKIDGLIIDQNNLF